MTELPEPKQFGDYGDWPGRAVLDTSGDRIGTVREIYLDDATDRPEWVLVDRDGGDPRFVPLADATVEDEAIRVACAADTVEAAPGLEPSKQLTQDEERELYSHYGVALSEDASDTVLPATGDEPAAETTPEPEPEPAEPKEPEPAEPKEPEPATTEPEPEPVPAPDPVPAPTPDPPFTTGGATTELKDDGPAELPAAGQTSEPEDTGPMVPPRPEPVAPDPVEPPSPSALDKVRERNVPLVAGIAAAIGAALILLVRRRRS